MQIDSPTMFPSKMQTTSSERTSCPIPSHIILPFFYTHFTLSPALLSPVTPSHSWNVFALSLSLSLSLNHNGISFLLVPLERHRKKKQHLFDNFPSLKKRFFSRVKKLIANCPVNRTTKCNIRLLELIFYHAPFFKLDHYRFNVTRLFM